MPLVYRKIFVGLTCLPGPCDIECSHWIDSGSGREFIESPLYTHLLKVGVG